MATKVMIKDVMANKVAVGSDVIVEGWVRTRRDSKAGLSFIAVSDGTCFSPIQIVAENSLSNYDSEIKRITSGCAIRVMGKLVESQGKNQAHEVQASSVEVVGWVEDPDSYPIQPKPHTPEFLREVAHLRPRTNMFGAVARIRHALSMAVHQFFDERQFYWVHTPLITSSDCEGAGDMFKVSTLDFANIPRNDKGEVDYSQDFFGNMVSDGMFHVFPVRNAPSIFPSAQYLRAVRSLMPYFPANWATDIYSIIHAISLYRHVFIRYSGANILIFADNGKFLAKKIRP